MFSVLKVFAVISTGIRTRKKPSKSSTVGIQIQNYFFNVGFPKEDIFLTTFYGLY